VVNKLKDIIVCPHMVMDAAVRIHQLVRLDLERLAPRFTTADVLDPVFKVGAPVELAVIDMLGYQLAERDSGALSVEGVPLVGDPKDKDTSRPQQRIPIRQRCKWERQVFEDMAGNDKVEASGSERQLCGVGQYIGRNQIPDFRILSP